MEPITVVLDSSSQASSGVRSRQTAYVFLTAIRSIAARPVLIGRETLRRCLIPPQPLSPFDRRKFATFGMQSNRDKNRFAGHLKSRYTECLFGPPVKMRSDIRPMALQSSEESIRRVLGCRQYPQSVATNRSYSRSVFFRPTQEFSGRKTHVERPLLPYGTCGLVKNQGEPRGRRSPLRPDCNRLGHRRTRILASCRKLRSWRVLVLEPLQGRHVITRTKRQVL